MEVRYRRGTEKSSMILSVENIDRKRYDFGMLCSNRIQGFLPVECKQMNGEVLLYYDISGRQSIAQIYRRMQMKGADLARLLEGILSSFREGDRYMLTAEHVLLDPEYIFMDRADGRIALCYIPGWMPEDADGEEPPSCAGAQVLAEFILKHLDHRDADALTLGYRFYQILTDGGKPVRTAAAQTLEAYRPEEAHAEDIPEFLNREEPGMQHANRDTGLYKNAQEEDGAARREAAAAARLEAPVRRRGTAARLEASVRRRRDAAYGADRRPPESEKAKEKGKEKDKEKRPQQQKRRGPRKIPVWFWILIAAVVILNAGADWYFSFDLTQIGGMAFCSIAVIWLTYTVCIERRREQESPWEEFFAEMEEREEEYLYAEDEEEMDEQALPGDRSPDPVPGEESSEDTTRVLSVSAEKRSFLLIAEPPATGQIRLEEGTWILGKSAAQSDIPLPSAAVSRVHAQMDVKKDMLTVTDLNSRNGTYVNGKQLEPNGACALKPSDRIRFADVSYIVKEAFS